MQGLDKTLPREPREYKLPSAMVTQMKNKALTQDKNIHSVDQTGIFKQLIQQCKCAFANSTVPLSNAIRFKQFLDRYTTWVAEGSFTQL